MKQPNLERLLMATLGGLTALTIAGGLIFLISAASSEISDSPSRSPGIQIHRARGSGRWGQDLTISSDDSEETEPKQKSKPKTEVAVTEETE